MEARPAEPRPDFVQLLERVATGARGLEEAEPHCPPGLARRCPKLPALVDSASDVCVVTTLDGRVLHWNPGARRLYGYAAAELQGKPVTALVVPERHDALQHFTERLRRGERIGPIDTEALRADGQCIDISVTVSPVRNDTGPIVVAVVEAHEQAEHKRSRKELRLARRESESMGVEWRIPAGSPNGLDKHGATLSREREAPRVEFASLVAHELASPIAAIRYLAGMMMVGGLPPEEQAHALSAICLETDVLQSLIADLESAVISESEEFVVQPRSIAVATLVAESIAFARTLPGEHPLTSKIDGNQQVLADPQRIGQVLRNLIENAAKYSSPGTPVELRALRRRGRMRIEVTDRGPGIPPDDRGRIFEKFERGHAGHSHDNRGLGLGLYLSRRLVQMHGSDLTVEPRPGGGSIFGFDLEVVP